MGSASQAVGSALTELRTAQALALEVELAAMQSVSDGQLDALERLLQVAQRELASGASQQKLHERQQIATSDPAAARREAVRLGEASHHIRRLVGVRWVA